MPPSGVHTHQALFYRDDDEYLEGLSHFAAPAVAAGDPVALALPRPKLDLVLGSLSDVTPKEVLDMGEVGRNPGRILSVIEGLLQAHRGRTLYYVGEPVWPGRTPEEIREAVRHEALINLALAGTQSRVLCPYDASALDDAVLESAARTHPTILEEGVVRTSDRYSEAMPPECEAPLSPPPNGALTRSVEEDALSSLRAAIRNFGKDNGIDAERVEDLQIVASELASNAIQHGTSPRHLTMWQTAGQVICEVANQGAIADPLAGRRRPQPRREHGMGLWIVHQLADLVEVRNRVRTRVRAHVSVA